MAFRSKESLEWFRYVRSCHAWLFRYSHYYVMPAVQIFSLLTPTCGDPCHRPASSCWAAGAGCGWRLCGSRASWCESPGCGSGYWAPPPSPRCCNITQSETDRRQLVRDVRLLQINHNYCKSLQVLRSKISWIFPDMLTCSWPSDQQLTYNPHFNSVCLSVKSEMNVNLHRKKQIEKCGESEVWMIRLRVQMSWLQNIRTTTVVHFIGSAIFR